MVQASTLERPAPAKRRLTYEEFLALDGDPHQEWVNGEAVRMPSVGHIHSEITGFLIALLWATITDERLGRVFFNPFNIHLGGVGRAPDVTVVLNEHLDRVRLNYLEGPPDIAIEVISPGGGARDRVEKFAEYEAGGVREYWLIDPQTETAEFYVLGADGRYGEVVAGEWFASTVVAGLRVKPAWFWERPTVKRALAEMAARE